MIPLSAVERVEVLRDGASAQYGSDAIAGVVNIILKKRASGGNLFATVGQYSTPAEDPTVSLNGWKGLKLGNEGSLTAGVEIERSANPEDGLPNQNLNYFATNAAASRCWSRRRCHWPRA